MFEQIGNWQSVSSDGLVQHPSEHSNHVLRVIYNFISLSPDQITVEQLLILIRSSYWGIENGLRDRSDVTLCEDAVFMTNANLAQEMATVSNPILGLFCQLAEFDFLPSDRRFCNANFTESFEMMTRY